MEIIKEVIVTPDGMPEDDYELHHWSLYVTWRGAYQGRSGGGYSVHVLGSRELSRAGNWGYPQPFQRWQYRFETLEEALTVARLHVDEVNIMGTTYADWRKRHANDD